MASSPGEEQGRAGHPTSPERVHFAPEEQGAPSPRTTRTRATVKYNRKAVQKMLATEEWIEEQLMVLFRCSNRQDVPVEISLDDLMSEDEDDYERWIRNKLSDCSSPQLVDAFTAELLEKVKHL